MAFIIEESDILVLHIPFCGGTWVRAAVDRLGIVTRPPTVGNGLGSKHGLRRQYDARCATAIVFVRHPLSWYESFWTRARLNTCDGPPGMLSSERRFIPYECLWPCMDADFSTFITNCLREQPGFVSRMYEWYIGPPGAPCVDFVGKLENLADDLTAALDCVGVDAKAADVPRENVREAITIEWHDDLRQRVIDAERPAINRFYDGACHG